MPIDQKKTYEVKFLLHKGLDVKKFQNVDDPNDSILVCTSKENFPDFGKTVQFQFEIPSLDDKDIVHAKAEALRNIRQDMLKKPMLLPKKGLIV